MPRLRGRVLIRAGFGGSTREFLDWLAARRLRYSVGMSITEDMQQAIFTLPDRI